MTDDVFKTLMNKQLSESDEQKISDLCNEIVEKLFSTKSINLEMILKCIVILNYTTILFISENKQEYNQFRNFIIKQLQDSFSNEEWERIKDIKK